MPRIIEFYRVADDFGCFSNFARFPIELDGLIWPTSEHYFQAQKFADLEYREQIRSERSPMNAARLGRDRFKLLRLDWDSVKVDVMRKAIHAKFTQHREIRNILFSTADAILVEHTANDCFWGDGGDGAGRNMLGKILMDVRDELRLETGGSNIE